MLEAHQFNTIKQRKQTKKCVRILALIPKWSDKNRKGQTNKNMSCVTKTQKPQKNSKHKKSSKRQNQKYLELCQYWQNTLQPEVSSPPGGGFFAMANAYNIWTSRLRDQIGPEANVVKKYIKWNINGGLNQFKICVHLEM